MSPQAVAVADATLLGALTEALTDAAAYNRSEMEPPAVVLWPDRDRQWEKLIPLLRPQLPHLLTLGAYEPSAGTGPAIWLKCAVAGHLDGVPVAAGVVPVLYMPGWSRADLRDVEGCPPEVQPLIELQFRGVWFTQANTKDWTVLAFLCSREVGLGLDVARDAATLDALQHALLQVARTPIDQLSGGAVTYAVLNGLVHRDPERAMLEWLDEPNSVREREADAWASFRGICQKRYGFDPDAEGRLGGAERLGARQGHWSAVWERFAEAPQSWPRITDLMRKVQPKFDGTLFDDRSAWPSENDARESALRAALLQLENTAHADALASVERLESDHGERRRWVWAKLGQAPLAFAVEELAQLGQFVRAQLPGTTCDELGSAYRSGGWRADAAVLRALVLVTAPADEQAVRAAIRALYLPWIEAHAQRLQQLLSAGPPPAAASVRRVEPGTCYLFVDGMRYDVAHQLAEVMLGRGWEVQDDWRWAALPTVTATAKPAASPVADLVSGGPEDAEFGTRVASSGSPLTPDRFRQLLGQSGVTWLPRTATGDPSGTAWTEAGDIDRRGHDEGARLARRIGECAADVIARVGELLDAGWQRVRLVTDHGWLLVPGGLPKVHLPAYLTASRWGRCAVLKDTATVEVPVVPWHWSPQVRVALAPGVGIFYEGKEYAHGGVSLQEAVIPELVVTRAAPPAADARITEVTWVNLRCRVSVEGASTGLHVDIRAKPADGTTSLASAKDVPEGGQVSLIIPDDDQLGCAAVVVLLDAAGRVVAKQPTTIGG
jgi:hypothetical protein